VGERRAHLGGEGRLKLVLLSGGAAQAVATAVAREAELQLEGSFGAVGAMQEKLLAGEPADVVILTQALVQSLVAQGRVEDAADLGVVRTGVAVRAGAPVPDISTPEALKHALIYAGGIYFPDPVKATAGIHFAKVLESLGLGEATAGRLRTFPNGATAMRELAQSTEASAMGCTQITEILATPGLALVGPLPKAHELATTYTAAAVVGSPRPNVARQFVERLASDATRGLRLRAGFEL
jgi:molybdate transport system substrate-binding protein